MTEQSPIINSIRRRVLVVDDEFINREILGHIVSQNYDVLYAENGAQAFEMIKSNKDILSLILLDLLMPEMDGYELLSLIQSDEELRRIPVIVLTSEKNAEVKCLQMGAVDFIPKPYDLPDVILARVGRSIQLAEDSKIIKETEKDPVSGLYTKRYFYRYCDIHNIYFPDSSMDAIVMNVNRFHLINEINGRNYGDEVLGILGRKIVKNLQGKNGIACRSDADTFYIYIDHQSDYDGFISDIANAVIEKTGNTNFSLRMGVYSESEKKFTVESMFDKAFHACSVQKNASGGYYSNSVVFYDNAMHEKEVFSERLISDMDMAIKEKQFKVFYQPKYNIKGDRPVLASAEALIRWIHPELGFISPGVFIPLFEENGLIHKLDRYVWHEAARQIREWKNKYHHSLPVSVNVSRVDILDPGLEGELADIINEFDLETGECLLEITESAYTNNSSQIISTVNNLRNMGFRVEMDDFGSGYSSLNMLASLPIDALKLDRGFIRNITKSEKNSRMVEIMISIADYLSVPVIAEGVEYEEQYRLLKDLGCDIIQGYYFSKPVCAEDFASLIEKELDLSAAEQKNT